MLRVNPFIATLGSMVLVRGVVYIVTGGAPVSGEDGLPSAFIAFGSARLFGIHYLVWVPALLLGALSALLYLTPYGRRVYATGGNKKRPISPALTYSASSLPPTSGAVRLPALLASCWRHGCNRASRPRANSTNLTAIAAVVLGGASLQGGEGMLYKSVIGVFIMIVLENGLNLLNVDLYWQRVAVGAVIVAAAAADRLRSRN